MWQFEPKIRRRRDPGAQSTSIRSFAADAAAIVGAAEGANTAAALAAAPRETSVAPRRSVARTAAGRPRQARRRPRSARRAPPRSLSAGWRRRPGGACRHVESGARGRRNRAAEYAAVALTSAGRAPIPRTSSTLQSVR